MKEKFAWESEDIIWEVWRDPVFKNLVLEIRNPERKTLNFIAVHAENGHLVFDGFDQQPDWWSKTRYVHKGMLVLEKYTNPDLPETQGLLVFDYTTNRMIWENPFLRFSHGIQEKLCCLTPQEETVWIRLNDGEVSAEATEIWKNNQFEHMHLLRPDFRTHPELIEFINSKSIYTQVENLYYGEPHSNILLCFEARTETGKMKCLWLLNARGESLWEKKWMYQHNYQPLIQFFWSENTLFVLENQHLITAYELD